MVEEPFGFFDQSTGPKPMENFSTRILKMRANKKCPPSCTAINRPSPKIARIFPVIVAYCSP